jgi:hypothetical protein
VAAEGRRFFRGVLHFFQDDEGVIRVGVILGVFAQRAGRYNFGNLAEVDGHYFGGDVVSRISDFAFKLEVAGPLTGVGDPAPPCPPLKRGGIGMSSREARPSSG